MEARKPTTSDYQNHFRIYAGDDYDPSRYVIWFEGQERTVTRSASESAADLWIRVCNTVLRLRHSQDPDESFYRRYAFSHIYAGVAPSEADKRRHLREWLIARLWRIAAPTLNDDHEERVEALCLLAKLYGMTPPLSTQCELTVRHGRAQSDSELNKQLNYLTSTPNR